jgi:hypothetical protein
MLEVMIQSGLSERILCILQEERHPKAAQSITWGCDDSAWPRFAEQEDTTKDE